LIETALQPSNYEASRYLGDIVEEVDKAFGFIGGMDFNEFLETPMVIYAVEKAMQNAVEACIQLNNNKSNKGQFTRIFPDFDFYRLKLIADSGRHDYGNTDPSLTWNELHGDLKNLRDAAEVILGSKRTK